VIDELVAEEKEAKLKYVAVILITYLYCSVEYCCVVIVSVLFVYIVYVCMCMCSCIIRIKEARTMRNRVISLFVLCHLLLPLFVFAVSSSASSPFSCALTFSSLSCH